MDGEKRQFIAEMQSAIQSGALTSSEIKGRLMRAIDKEFNKTDSPADIEFIRAGQSLLDDIYGYKIEIDHEASRNALKQKMKASSWKRSIFRIARNSVLTAAAILVVMFVTDGVFHLQWFEGHSTEDEQQYVVSGHEIDPSLIEKGNAGETDDAREINTTDLAEAIAVLGFTPPMPTWLPEGWAISDYYAYLYDGHQMFRATYTSTDEDIELQYELKRFSDVQSVQDTFEQAEHGDMEHIGDWDIYISSNINSVMAIWCEGTVYYSVYGTIELEALRKMIHSINKGVT